MKELSVEEKAKRYDEAIKRAGNLHKDAVEMENNMTSKTCEIIFPELKESEDERIRKGIIALIEFGLDDKSAIAPGYNITKEEAIAWLVKQGQTFTKKDVDDAYLKGVCDAKHEIEKQGEQPTDKIDTKFKVGDWIVNKGQSYLIADIDYEQRRYLFEIGGYTHEQLNWEYIENADNKYHLWTLQDAKEGDVLVNWNNTTFIFKAIENKTVKFHIAYNERLNTIATPLTKLSHQGLAEPQFEFHPATKEQRDLLFQKMKEAGYEWDDEKKELKKIMDKSSWSEQDERNLKGVIDEIEANKNSDPDCDLATHNRFLSCLKSLRHRIGI